MLWQLLILLKCFQNNTSPLPLGLQPCFLLPPTEVALLCCFSSEDCLSECPRQHHFFPKGSFVLFFSFSQRWLYQGLWFAALASALTEASSALWKQRSLILTRSIFSNHLMRCWVLAGNRIKSWWLKGKVQESGKGCPVPRIVIN